jgi:hypothetical protein
MKNKVRRDFRILQILIENMERWLTCEELFKEVCNKTHKNGVKSTKALSKILQRFPLMKSKKVIVATDRIGIEVCNYITVYRLEENYMDSIPEELIILM